MKNSPFLITAAYLGVLPSFVLFLFNNGLKVSPAIVSFHYDSVKVTSTYRFNNAAPAAKEAYARVVYPVFQDNDLNYIIKNAVLSPLKVKYQFQNTDLGEHPALSNVAAINNGAADYRALAANFIRQFEDQAPQEDLKAYWYADIHVNVLAQKQDYTAIVCSKDFFTGGLHDLYVHTYLNYDAFTCQVFDLASQLKPGKVNELAAVAERIFRKDEGLNAVQDLDGYFFENQKFNLPINFTITGKGLIFFYDYYEIKPFAAGTTQLLIPFAQIKDLVLPHSILANQMNKH